MKDGIIELNTPFAKKIGFTKEKFDGYLWKQGKYIYISFIVSRYPRQGNLSKLFDNILKEGYGIKVPTPLGVMALIVRKKGFRQTTEYSNINECPAEVWVKEVNHEQI